MATCCPYCRNLVAEGTTWIVISWGNRLINTPQKMNGWNLRIHPIFQTIIFRCKMFIFWGVPSWKLTSPPKKRYFWRWCSFSPGGICARSLVGKTFFIGDFIMIFPEEGGLAVFHPIINITCEWTHQREGLAHHFKLDLEKYQNISLYSIWNSMISQSKDATSRASGLDTNNEVANRVVLSLSRCQSCGQMWMSVRISWRGWAPPPVRAKRSSTTSAGAEGSTKIRVLASGFLVRNPLGTVDMGRVFRAYIQLPCSCLARLAGNLFFPCLSALRNWVPCNCSMLILRGCKPNHIAP